jgi:hypothetical protein
MVIVLVREVSSEKREGRQNSSNGYYKTVNIIGLNCPWRPYKESGVRKECTAPVSLHTTHTHTHTHCARPITGYCSDIVEPHYSNHSMHEAHQTTPIRGGNDIIGNWTTDDITGKTTFDDLILQRKQCGPSWPIRFEYFKPSYSRGNIVVKVEEV